MNTEDTNTNIEELISLQEKILEEIAVLRYGDLGKNASIGDRAADKIVSLVGSWRFIIFQGGVLLIWLFANAFWLVNSHVFDPYPFILLNLVLSFQAAFTAPVILMATNRSEDRDRQRAEEAYSSIDKIEHIIETRLNGRK